MLSARLCSRRILSFFWQQPNSYSFKSCLHLSQATTRSFSTCFLLDSYWTKCISTSLCVRHSSTDMTSHRELVYEGPLSRSVQLVKVFSLSTALATMIVTPILMVYGKQSVPIVGKLAIGLTIMLAGTTTTFLLHWVTKVYVHRMFYNAVTEKFTVETMSLLARRQETEFGLDEVRLAVEPTAFTTFQAKGKKYFLHTDLLEAQQVLQFIRENRI